MKFVKHFSCLILLLSIIACTPKHTQAPIRHHDTKSLINAPNKVALLLPLSGPQKAIGTHLKNAAQLALFDANYSNFELAFYDTKGNAKEAATVARQAADDGAQLIIGPLFSNTSTASYEAIKGRVPIVSFSNNESIAKEGLYTFGFLAEVQIDRLLSFLAERNKNNIVLLAPYTRYGALIKNHVLQKADRYKQAVTVLNYTTPDNMKDTAQALKQTPDIDVLVLPEGGGHLETMISSLLYHDVDLDKYQLVGTSLWDGLNIKNTALMNAWYVAVNPARRRNFEEEYKGLYNQNPPRLATLAYDAISMAVTLARSGNLSHNALRTPNGFEGLDGPFKLMPDGRVMRALAIVAVRPGTRDTVISAEHWPDPR